MKRLIYFFIFFTLSYPALAEEVVVVEETAGNLPFNLLISSFAILVVILLIVALVLLKTFKILLAETKNPKPLIVTKPEKLLEYKDWMAVEKLKPSIWNKVLSLRPLSEEEGQKMEHEFDGIVELDNPTPPWFNWLFYGSIAVAICYMLYYHVFDWGKLQDDEYLVELMEAKAAKDAYLAKSGNAIDENSVKESKEASVISSGMAIYKTNCEACHGDKGQGTVGPNLTDDFWLHGGKINNVFKTIKYGVTEKGMISWEKTLSPKQISEVSNYIKSLKGSNPANGKAPQGVKES